MIACTSPAGTASDTPFRIGLSATVAWRLVISSIVVRGSFRWAAAEARGTPAISNGQPFAGRRKDEPLRREAAGMALCIIGNEDRDRSTIVANDALYGAHVLIKGEIRRINGERVPICGPARAQSTVPFSSKFSRNDRLTGSHSC